MDYAFTIVHKTAVSLPNAVCSSIYKINKHTSCIILLQYLHNSTRKLALSWSPSLRLYVLELCKLIMIMFITVLMWVLGLIIASESRVGVQSWLWRMFRSNVNNYWNNKVLRLHYWCFGEVHPEYRQPQPHPQMLTVVLLMCVRFKNENSFLNKEERYIWQIQHSGVVPYNLYDVKTSKIYNYLFQNNNNLKALSSNSKNNTTTNEPFISSYSLQA